MKLIDSNDILIISFGLTVISTYLWYQQIKMNTAQVKLNEDMVNNYNRVIGNYNKVLKSYEENRKNLVEVSNDIKKEFANLDTAIRNNYSNTNFLFIALFEYFNIILSVNGNIKVNPKTFLSDLLDDFEEKHPTLKGIVKIPEDIDQEEIFNSWKVYYEAKYPKASLEPIEGIFPW